jgi:hypothetical protein
MGVISHLIRLLLGNGCLLRLWVTGWPYPVVFCSATHNVSDKRAVFVKLGDAGRHTAYILSTDPSKLATLLKIQAAAEYIYMVGITFPRAAILMLYLRIFAEHKSRIATKIVLTFTIINWIANGIIADSVVCQPFAFRWDKTINGYCGNMLDGYRYVSFPNIAIDLAIVVLPISTLYNLNISWTRKLGIFLTFLTGSL